MQGVLFFTTRGPEVLTRRLLTLIWLGLGGLLFGQPAWALDCEAETLYYNGKTEKLHTESDLFADTEFLAWGTEVCPIRTHNRWMTTWTEVRLKYGDTGWLDQDDLLTVDAFGDVALARHVALRRQLQDLITEIAQLEVRIKELDREVWDATLQDVLTPWLDVPVAENDVDEATAKPPATDLNAVWQAQDYTVVRATHGAFAGRTRSVIELVAPNAVTREQRLATLMEEALRVYRQRGMDTVYLILRPDASSKETVWVLASITFAADRCGWTGEQCQSSHWSNATANTAVFTEEQLRIEAFVRENRNRFRKPFVALNEEGQPMSQAGWACYELLDIPAGGACYTEDGWLMEDEDKTACTSELGEFMGLLWLRADEGWGRLDTLCAQEQLHRYAASQLDLDLATVAGNLEDMFQLKDSSSESMEIPRALEQQQDFER